MSAWDGIWWAIVTVTTVGCGDITPKTTAGRIIAIMVMFVGIGTATLVIAAAAQHASSARGGRAASRQDERAEARTPAVVAKRAAGGPTTAVSAASTIHGEVPRAARSNVMSAAEIRERLLQLAWERLDAEAAGLGRNAAYMADLDDEVAACRAAYVGAAVTEIAVLRGELFGRGGG